MKAKKKRRKKRLAGDYVYDQKRDAVVYRPRARSNPKIHPAVWVGGAVLLAGAGYLTYRYFKTHFTVAGGVAYGVPANTAITLSVPAGGVWTGLTASDGSQIQVALGQTGPLQFTAGAVGTTYTVAWTLNNMPATATITAQ
jgi:hypothetical protein